MAISKYVKEVNLGVKNLLLHKLRSFLTMLGVVFGVGSVIAMLAVGEGASKDALDRIRSLGSLNIIINSTKSLEEETTVNKDEKISSYGLWYEDERRIKAGMPSVRKTVPVKVVRKAGRLGMWSLELRIIGTTVDWFELVKRPF